MSTETIVEPVEQEVDLDTFSADFFGRKPATPPQASEEEAKTPEEESDATPNDTQDGEDENDTPAPEDNDDDEAPKPEKKSRAQERIEELNKKYRETERQLNELRAQFEQNIQKPAPETKVTAAETSPNPDATNEDGSPKYPLGEYDPNYLSDLVKHRLEVELRAQNEKQEQQRIANQKQEEIVVLSEAWTEKLAPAQERYPDFAEKAQDLVSTFGHLDKAYGDYLGETLMRLEYGPDVLYYLANNPDEAVRLVNSGATMATIGLGGLNQKFAIDAEAKKNARPKTSAAPPPPPTNKGSAVAATEAPDDTDDLEAFSAKFFKKKK